MNQKNRMGGQEHEKVTYRTVQEKRMSPSGLGILSDFHSPAKKAKKRDLRISGETTRKYVLLSVRNRDRKTSG